MKIVTTEHQCRYSGGTALTVALALVLVILAMLAMANPARAADLSVTRNTNSGIGTLRQAVDTANGNTEADTITFNLPEGQRTIRLTSQINFTAPQETTVDGTDQSVTVSGNNETRVFQVNSGANSP